MTAATMIKVTASRLTDVVEMDEHDRHAAR